MWLGQGVYVLTDNGFKPFTRMSMASSSEAVAKAQPVSIYSWFLMQHSKKNGPADIFGSTFGFRVES